MKFCEEVGGEGLGVCGEGHSTDIAGSLLNHMTTIAKVGVSYVDHMTIILKWECPTLIT